MIDMMTGSSDLHLLEKTLTKRMRSALVLSVSGVFLDGYDITIIGVALLSIIPAFHATPIQVGYIASATLIGNFIGALAFGHLADRIGRRPTFLYDMVFFVVFAVLSGFSQNIWQLILWRFLLGVGIGADYALASPIIAEIVPARIRGRLLVVNWATAWIVGELVAFAVAFWVLSEGWGGTAAWRWILISGAIPAVLILFARQSFPETPRWYLAHGRAEEAQKALAQYADSDSTLAIGDLKQTTSTPVRVNYLGELFSRKYISNTIFGALNYFFEGLPFYTVALFLPLIIKSSGLTSKAAIAGRNLEIQATALLGIAICFLMIDTAGRKLANYVGFSLAGLAILVTILLGFPPPAGVLFILFAAVMVGMLIGPASTNNLYLGELWPTRIRATGAGIGAAAGRIGAILGTLVMPSLIASHGVRIALILPLVFCILGFLNTLVLGPETKGKTLEQLYEDTEPAPLGTHVPAH